MVMHLPALVQMAHWARSFSKRDHETLEQLAKDKSEAKAEICAVMERLADKHGISLREATSATLQYVDSALDELTFDLEEELRRAR